eukprot:m.237444 g.237444  ORF g.237444 m.237444 type:complete len:259 (-) comp18953_c0_seq2:1071-1847(-)
MKVLAILVATALVCSVSAANKKNSVRVAKQQIHKIPCGTESYEYPITQKGDFVGTFGYEQAGAVEAPKGYALLQRNAELQNSYLEINLFTDSDRDLVESAFVVTESCAAINKYAHANDDPTDPMAKGNYTALPILNGRGALGSGVTYAHLVANNPIIDLNGTFVVDTDTFNYLFVTVAPGDGNRVSTNYGEDGLAATRHLYIARYPDTRAVVLTAGEYIVACADLEVVECAVPKVKKNKKNKQVEEETTTKKAKKEAS